MVASVVQLALLVTNVECIAFGRDAFYIYMESPARADVCRSLKRSDSSLLSVLLLYSPFFLSTVLSYSYLLSAPLAPRLAFRRLVDAQRLYSKNASSEVLRFFSSGLVYAQRLVLGSGSAEQGGLVYAQRLVLGTYGTPHPQTVYRNIAELVATCCLFIIFRNKLLIFF